MLHDSEHPLSGKTVKIKVKAPLFQQPGEEFNYKIEDWWDRVYGDSWMNANGNLAAIGYAIRSGSSNQQIPTDDNVVYGKIDGLGYLIHTSEIVDNDATMEKSTN